jgi:hypothetical protein
MSDLDLKSRQLYDELSHTLISNMERHVKNGRSIGEILCLQTAAVANLFAFSLAQVPMEQLREDIIGHFRYTLEEALKIRGSDVEKENNTEDVSDNTSGGDQRNDDGLCEEKPKQ